MTIAEALEYAAGTFEAAGIDDSKTDARLLLSFVTGQDRTFFLTHEDEELDDPDEEKFKELVKKRSERFPLQLITGVQDFMGFEFDVSPDVLIPRFDTEFLVEEALKEITDGAKVLDLCCGSGCIIISLLKLTNDVEGYAADISEAALKLTRENAEKLGVDLNVIKSDLFDGIEGKFDFIISNPPYIRSGVIPTLMSEVKDYEPLLALDGGEDGLDIYRRIAAEAADHLSGGGMLLMEIGFDEGDAVKEILKKEGYKNTEVFRDYSGNERVIRCLKGWTT